MPRTVSEQLAVVEQIVKVFSEIAQRIKEGESPEDFVTYAGGTNDNFHFDGTLSDYEIAPKVTYRALNVGELLALMESRRPIISKELPSDVYYIRDIHLEATAPTFQPYIRVMTLLARTATPADRIRVTPEELQRNYMNADGEPFQKLVEQTDAASVTVRKTQ